MGWLLSKQLNRWNVFCGVYKSIIVDRPACPSSSTAKSYDYNNESEKLGVIYFNPINISTMTSEIYIHPPKIAKVLTQWDLLTLGPTLIYATEYMNYLLWFL